MLLLGAQAARAALASWLWLRLSLAPTELTRTLYGMVEFLLLGLGLWLLKRPAMKDLGYSWEETSRREKLWVGLGGGLLLAEVASTFLFDWKVGVQNLWSALLIPLVEESLFRGWGWGQLSQGLEGRAAGLFTYALITGLFALWHLGYTDVIYLRGGQTALAELGRVMAFKVLVGGAVGLLAGLPRWRSGHIYGSLVLHGLWNLFGR